MVLLLQNISFFGTSSVCQAVSELIHSAAPLILSAVFLLKKLLVASTNSPMNYSSTNSPMKLF